MVVFAGATGCGTLHGLKGWHGNNVPPPLIENPLFVPALDREFLWNQTVDVVDDYFRIQREERVHLIGGILTEGRIETLPITGSTLLEPWRKDSTPGYEKWHATLQSIRRRAMVRVIPNVDGYLLDVNVLKELEDLDKPESATAGAGSILRHDGSQVRLQGPQSRGSITLGWIPLGRDISLEQRMLADISARLDLGNVVHLPAVETPLEELQSPPPSDGSSGPELLPQPLRRVPGQEF